MENENETAVGKVGRENTTVPVCEEVKYGSDIGIQVFYKGVPFPQKGFPFPPAVHAINTPKRLFIEALKLHPILFSFKRAIKAYNRISFDIVRSFRYKECYQVPISKEIKRFVYNFLLQLGYDEVDCYQTSEIFGAIFHFDDSYRNRVQDLMTETSKEKLLKHPRKEIKRLAKLAYERNNTTKGAIGISKKFTMVANLVSLLILIPKYRKAFVKALNLSNFENFQFDEGDRVWCSILKGYDFFGKSYEERMKMYPYKPELVNVKFQ